METFTKCLYFAETFNRDEFSNLIFNNSHIYETLLKIWRDEINDIVDEYNIPISKLAQSIICREKGQNPVFDNH